MCYVKRRRDVVARCEGMKRRFRNRCGRLCYWRRGTHAVTSPLEAKHAAACDSLRKDLEAAHRRHAALSDELNEAHDERLAVEASKLSAAEARDRAVGSAALYNN